MIVDEESSFANRVEKTIWADVLDSPRPSIPLLAHYTSLEVAEKILGGGEIWFSNPRNMNDWDELRLGVDQLQLLARIQFDCHLGSGSRTVEDFLGNLLYNIEQRLQEFEKFGAKDTYVLCFSEHVAEDYDGRLSMWRGYGNGGSGAAIVFDGSAIPLIDGHPLVVMPVSYEPGERREEMILELLNRATRLANE